MLIIPQFALETIFTNPYHVSLIIGIIGGAIVTGGSVIIRHIYYELIVYRSNLSGDWEISIYGDEDNIVKRDLMCIKYNSRTKWFDGEINRAIPLAERHRKWRCKGKFIGNLMFFIFWPEDETDCRRGVEYLTHTGNQRYDGHYVRYQGSDSSWVEVEISIKKFRNNKEKKEWELKYLRPSTHTP